MFPLGHAAVGYLAYSLGAERNWWPDLDAWLLVALAVGTQLPDLVDKPLGWHAGVLPGGRTLAHSLLFLLPALALLVAALSRLDRGELGVAVAVGALAHVAVDPMPALWTGDRAWHMLAWPLLEGHLYEEGPPSVLAMLRASTTEPWFLLEFVLAGAALVRWRTDDYPGLGLVVDRARVPSTTRSAEDRGD